MGANCTCRHILIPVSHVKQTRCEWKENVASGTCDHTCINRALDADMAFCYKMKDVFFTSFHNLQFAVSKFHKKNTVSKAT